MSDLLSRVRSFVRDGHSETLASPAQQEQVEEAESELGFRLPMLLRRLLQEVGNGGFGPGYGVIGCAGGHQSDFGTLSQTFHQLRGDAEEEGEEWPSTLLPFCEWGCNIFSCVDCEGDELRIHTFEEGEVTEQEYSLPEFFEMWMNGVDILATNTFIGGTTEEIVNPFSGEVTRISRSRKPGSSASGGGITPGSVRFPGA